VDCAVSRVHDVLQRKRVQLARHPLSSTRNIQVFRHKSLTFIVLVALIATACSQGTATPIGTVAPTGNMITGRYNGTATPLQDGRVLFTGGDAMEGSHAPLASAELYDPTAGTFSATGSMAAARVDQKATLLQDGRVLIAGGADGPGHDLASAEIYDPEKGNFSVTGSMTTPRSGQTATLLADGRVLITGGWGGGPGLKNGASAELYDPKTGTFSATGSMTTPRVEHTATLLSDGRVLIAAGHTQESSGDVNSAELYDPKTGTFSATGSMPVALSGQGAVLLKDGRVLFVQDYGAWLYDPKSGTFSVTVSTDCGSLGPAHVGLLPDGRAFCMGEVGSAEWPAHFELYDPSSGTFTDTLRGVSELDFTTTTVLQDGRVLVAGGQGQYGKTAYVYTP
jgi:hypothetical protein